MSSLKQPLDDLPTRMRVIPLIELLRRSLWAVIQPHRAFQRIQSQERVAYVPTLIFLVSWGVVYALLHFRGVDHRWLWSYTWEGMWARLVNSLLASPGNWLLAVLGVKVLARLCRHPVSVYWAEVAAFYLWVVWALMPVADLLHPLLDLPTWTVAVPGMRLSPLGHAGWIVAFPCLLAELTCLLAYVLHGRRFRWIKAAISAALTLGGVRLVLEPIAEKVTMFLGVLGFSSDVWVSSMWVTALSVLQLIGWRLWFSRLPRWAVVVGTSLACLQWVRLGFERKFALW